MTIDGKFECTIEKIGLSDGHAIATIKNFGSTGLATGKIVVVRFLWFVEKDINEIPLQATAQIITYKDNECTLEMQELNVDTASGLANTGALPNNGLTSTFWFGDQEIYPKTAIKNEKVMIEFSFKPLTALDVS
ncbi:MAG: hypothetical protein V2I33_26540 [Kangiellaceae bacterium]|jgi:hypothetical protein|nr:hypothetical protein [Kangiellaceae bacterium]